MKTVTLAAIAASALTVLAAAPAIGADLENTVSGCSKKDQLAITAAVAATKDMKVVKIDSGQCVGKWAVTFPITAEPGGIEYTQVLQKTGGAWKLVERTGSVCGNGPVKGDYYKKPAAAKIAPEIYISACLTN